MTIVKTLAGSLAAALFLSACNSAQANTAAAPSAAAVDPAELTQILSAQPDKTKARYQYRNPAETLTFFGLTPGMKVAEALPGGSWDGSWYTRIIAPYLGKAGHLSGVDYPAELWPAFGGKYAKSEFIEAKAVWPAKWAGSVSGALGDAGPSVSAFTLSTVPGDAAGTYDAVLFIRALHNLSRFEADGGYMTMAINAAGTMLKPGGMVGVVQHRAPETMTAELANGQTGYLKQSDVIAAFEAAGFILKSTSEINANAKDVPGEGDIVWRLLPSLRVEDEAKRELNKAIGETDRMTLKFVKK